MWNQGHPPDSLIMNAFLTCFPYQSQSYQKRLAPSPSIEYCEIPNPKMSRHVNIPCWQHALMNRISIVSGHIRVGWVTMEQFWWGGAQAWGERTCTPPSLFFSGVFKLYLWRTYQISWGLIFRDFRDWKDRPLTAIYTFNFESGFLNLPWSFNRVLSFFSIFFLRSHFPPTFSRLFSRPFFSPFFPTFLSTVSESHGTNHVTLGLFFIPVVGGEDFISSSNQ